MTLELFDELANSFLVMTESPNSAHYEYELIFRTTAATYITAQTNIPFASTALTSAILTR